MHSAYILYYLKEQGYTALSVTSDVTRGVRVASATSNPYISATTLCIYTYSVVFIVYLAYQGINPQHAHFTTLPLPVTSSIVPASTLFTSNNTYYAINSADAILPCIHLLQCHACMYVT